MSITTVEQALRILERRTVEQADLFALPIARHGVWAQPPKEGYHDRVEASINPYGELLYRWQAKEEIDPIVASTFLELSGEGKIPSWAIALIDVRKLRAAAE